MMRSLLGAFALLCACGGGGTPAPVSAGGEPVARPEAGDAGAEPAPPPEPPPPPAPDAEGVVLLDAGDEPRSVLRYDVKDKTRRKVELVLVLEPEGGAKTAPRTVGWSYELRREGDGFQLKTKVTRADPPLKGKSGTWTFSARGRHAAATAENSAQQLVLATQAEHMLPVFPAEPIGAGARWTSVIAMSPGLGVTPVPGVVTWELTGVAGTVVTANGTLEVRGEDIPFRDATMSLEAKGTIRAKLDLARFTGESTLELDIRSEAEGGKAVAYTSTSTMRVR